jgi:hypothetical protein
MEAFNGYRFQDPEMAKRMKYIAILPGDLDINNAYAFEDKESLQQFIDEGF